MFVEHAHPAHSEVTLRNRVGLWLGPLAFLAILFFTDLDPNNPLITRMAAVTAWMAIWWICESIPLAATALMPLALFPLLGIMHGRHVDVSRKIDFSEASLLGDFTPGDLSISFHNVASQYMSWVTFLLLGGFLMAIAIKKWGLHKRIALNILCFVGSRLHTIVLAFMLACGFLSMWLSNTATTVMLLPIALSVILLFEESHSRDGKTLTSRDHNFSLALLLGLAYAASIGGMATLTGTPPNAILAAQFEQLFPDGPGISFASWSMMAMPFSLAFLALAWWLLTHVIFPLPASGPFDGGHLLRQQLQGLGPVRSEEKRLAVVFVAVVLLWFTRKEHLLGPEFGLYGWSHYLDLLLGYFSIQGVGSLIDDSTVAIAMALALFTITAKSTGGRLLDHKDLQQVPWDILILFGGGLALAKGFSVSGFSGWIAQEFEVLLGGGHASVIVVGAVAFVTSLTELASNTATVATTIPIMASLAQGIEVNPLLLMIPTAMAASCAFMLPVATPPNAVVYGTKRIPIIKMIIAGIWLDLVSLIFLTLAVITLGDVVFGVLGDFPVWAQR